MKLGEWISEQIESGVFTGKKDAYRRLSDEIDKRGGEPVSALTIEHAAGGMLLVNYRKAKAISVSTDGAVTITDLCEG